MSEESIHQPHDKLFKAGFSDPANTAAFLRWEIPSTLSEKIDWDMIQLPQETLELLLKYMLRSDIDKDAFDRKVRLIARAELRTTAMTLAEQLRNEGLQKGLQKGLQEGILEALTLRFGPIPAGLRTALEAIGDESHLRSLRKASIQAASLEEFTCFL